ncbi:MAG: glycosyltransferase family 4 protein [Nitrospirota bacterium]
MSNGAPLPERILMTADTMGGVWTYAVELSHMLWKHGIEVVLATMGAPLTEEQWKEIARIPDIKVYESAFKLEWMEQPWDDIVSAGAWLLSLEEEIDPDIVHLNGYAHGVLSFRAPKLVVGHSCVLSWWQAVRNEPAPGEWETYREAVTQGLHAADFVIAPTHAMLDMLHLQYGPIVREMVVPNGRDPELFLPGIKEPFVLTAGRLWDRAKNVAALHRIAPSLSWPVYSAGEEQYPSGADEHGATRIDNFRRLGRLSARAIASWLARASIYALPAYYEPFGLSILEAGLSACALVLGDIPSLREIWDDAALFVHPDDTKMLREALKALIRDDAYRAAMAAKARMRALEFSPHRMVSGYLAVYQAMMAEKRRSIKENTVCV